MNSNNIGLNNTLGPNYIDSQKAPLAPQGLEHEVVEVRPNPFVASNNNSTTALSVFNNTTIDLTKSSIALIGKDYDQALIVARKEIKAIDEKISTLDLKIEEMDSTNPAVRYLKAARGRYEEAKGSIKDIIDSKKQDISTALTRSSTRANNDEDKELIEVASFNSAHQKMILATKLEEQAALQQEKMEARASNNKVKKEQVERREIDLEEEIKLHQKANECFSNTKKNLEGNPPNERAATCWNNAGAAYSQVDKSNTTNIKDPEQARLAREVLSHRKEAAGYFEKAAICFSSQDPHEQQRGEILEQLGNLANQYIGLLNRETSFKLTSTVQTSQSTTLEASKDRYGFKSFIRRPVTIEIQSHEEEFYKKYPTLKEVKELLTQLANEEKSNPLMRSAKLCYAKTLQRLVELQQSIKDSETYFPELTGELNDISSLYQKALEKLKPIIDNPTAASNQIKTACEEGLESFQIAEFKSTTLFAPEVQDTMSKHAMTLWKISTLEEQLQKTGPTDPHLATCLKNIIYFYRTSLREFDQILNSIFNKQKLTSHNLQKHHERGSLLFQATEKNEQLLSSSTEESEQTIAFKLLEVAAIAHQNGLENHALAVLLEGVEGTDEEILSHLETLLTVMDISSLKEQFTEAKNHGNIHQAALLEKALSVSTLFLKEAAVSTTSEVLANSKSYLEIINTLKKTADTLSKTSSLATSLNNDKATHYANQHLSTITGRIVKLPTNSLVELQESSSALSVLLGNLSALLHVTNLFKEALLPLRLLSSELQDKLTQATRSGNTNQSAMLKKALLVSELFIQEAVTAQNIEEFLTKKDQVLETMNNFKTASERASQILNSVTMRSNEYAATAVNQELAQITNNLSTNPSNASSELQKLSAELLGSLNKLSITVNLLERPLQAMEFSSLKASLAQANQQGNNKQAILLTAALSVAVLFVQEAFKAENIEEFLKDSNEWLKVVNNFKEAATITSAITSKNVSKMISIKQALSNVGVNIRVLALGVGLKSPNLVRPTLSDLVGISNPLSELETESSSVLENLKKLQKGVDLLETLLSSRELDTLVEQVNQARELGNTRQQAMLETALSVAAELFETIFNKGTFLQESNKLEETINKFLAIMDFFKQAATQCLLGEYAKANSLYDEGVQAREKLRTSL